jgi:hypothetical protein
LAGEPQADDVAGCPTLSGSQIANGCGDVDRRVAGQAVLSADRLLTSYVFSAQKQDSTITASAPQRRAEHVLVVVEPSAAQFLNTDRLETRCRRRAAFQLGIHLRRQLARHIPVNCGAYLAAAPVFVVAVVTRSKSDLSLIKAGRPCKNTRSVAVSTLFFRTRLFRALLEWLNGSGGDPPGSNSRVGGPNFQRAIDGRFKGYRTGFYRGPVGRFNRPRRIGAPAAPVATKNAP